LFPFALIAAVGSASLAMASTTATGTIKSLDMKDHSITLVRRRDLRPAEGL
jgi:hypothetical protein